MTDGLAPIPRARVYAGLCLQVLISAGTYLFAKRALHEMPALTLGLIRFCGASAVFSVLLFLLPRGARLPPRGMRLRLFALGFIAVPLNQGFFLYGLQLSTPAHAALLYSLTPICVLLIAQRLLRERPGARTVFGTLLALGGTVFVLVSRGQLDLSRGPLLGDLLLCVAVLAWAVYTVAGRPIVAAHGALGATAWSLMAGTLLYLPIGLGSISSPDTRAQLAAASPAAWWGIAYLVVITSVVSYFLWYWALGHLPAAQVAVFSNLQPLVTALLAHAFLGEAITVQFLAGAGVVMVGVLLAQSRPRVAGAAPGA